MVGLAQKEKDAGGWRRFFRIYQVLVGKVVGISRC